MRNAPSGFTLVERLDSLALRTPVSNPVPRSLALLDLSDLSPASQEHVRELNILSLPPKGEGIEREARYLMRRSLLEQRVNLAELPHVEIFQAYFRRRMVAALVQEVLASYKGELLFPVEMFTSARVRRVIDGDTIQFLLEVKGSKTGARRAKIERPELSIEISHERFYELLSQATRGFVDKTRYSAAGFALARNGEKVALTAQLDIIHGTGKVREGNRIWLWKPNREDFASIDLELPYGKLLRSLRRQEHSFEFLKDGAVELSAQSRKIREAMSVKRIAGAGVDRRARKVLNKLIAA